MTTTTTAAGRAASGPARDPYAGFGRIVAAPGRDAKVHGMLGGTGDSEWRQLANPGHLKGKAWDGPLEWVTIFPGGSCGEHLHDEREEIYFLVSGEAWMRINGKERKAVAGDLITCPMGTRHAIGVREDAGPMTFFVTEMTPGRRPWQPHEVAHEHMPDLLRPAEGYRGNESDWLRVGWVDLKYHLTGPWGRFSLVEVPAGEQLGPFTPPRAGTSEVTVILSGKGEVRHGGEILRDPPPTRSVSELPARHVGGDVDEAPAGTAIASVSWTTIRNTSDSGPLLMLQLGVTC